MFITKDIKEAIAILKKGGVVVYPTDTAYGLGAKFSDQKAATRIYKIKGRSRGKPLPAIAAGLAMVKKFFRLSARELALAKKYWPGALSLLLQIKTPPLGKGRLASGGGLTGGVTKISLPPLAPPYKGGEIGVVVRVPNSKIARKLSRAIGEPIFSTSANLSGKSECYSAKDVIKQFYHRKNIPSAVDRLRAKPDLIFDGGRLRKKKPSTIIKVVGDKIEILRQGPVRIMNYELRIKKLSKNHNS